MILNGQISLTDCVYFPGYSAKCVSFICLGIWWRHEIWVSKILNFLENEKSFWREIKNIFPSAHVVPFRLTKQISKNVVDTTFNSFLIEIPII